MSDAEREMLEAARERDEGHSKHRKLDGLYKVCERAEADLAAAREVIADLLAAILTAPCPYPARDGIYTVKDCIDIYECECDNRAAIAKAQGTASRACYPPARRDGDR